MNVKKFKRSAASMTDATINEIIVAAANQPFKLVTEPRQDVLEVARFIANIEPSYINSTGKYVTLSMLRSLPTYGKDDFEYILDKLADMVKGFILSGSETAISGKTITVKTALTKGKLIRAALAHLLTGCEIFKDPKDFKNLLTHSCLVSRHKVSYAYMVGVALALDYSSVPEMLNDFAITFVDQAENLRAIGRLVFYDGSVRTEVL